MTDEPKMPLDPCAMPPELWDQPVEETNLRVKPKGRTFYVGSAHLNAGAKGNDGQNVLCPLPSLREALSSARAYDWIIIGSGHTETIYEEDGLLVLVDNLTVMCLGTGDRRARFVSVTRADKFALIVLVILQGLMAQGQRE